MNEYVIYTKWVAYELRKKGFEILRTDINPNKPQFDCWIFEDSAELRSALSNVTKK